MGHTILFYHRVGDACYAPDGYFGHRSDSELTLPVEDPRLIERFIADFGLHRDGLEPGLSVVVPYYDLEMATTDVLNAVIVEYFYPILAGRLSVRVRGPGMLSGRGDITADKLIGRLDDLRGLYDQGLDEVVSLAVWARDAGQHAVVELATPNATMPPEWSPNLVPEELAPTLADQFKKGERLAFRISLVVHANGQRRATTHFDVYLQSDLSDRGYPPVFVRNGIRIPKVRERRIRGHRLFALVVVDDRPLASLLGDAETPAHTHWSAETRNFKGRYEHGKAIIEFVSEAPRQLAEILSRKYEQQDRLILADLFPRPPLEDGIVGGPKPQQDEGEEPEYPVPPVDTRLDPFCVQRIEGGFRISCSSDDRECPSRVHVEVAYDRSRGNPLKRYHPNDFDIANLNTSLAGAKATIRKDNRIDLTIHDRDEFFVQVTGFDPRRDLFVRAWSGAASND